jgi:hypothetical protein
MDKDDDERLTRSFTPGRALLNVRTVKRVASARAVALSISSFSLEDETRRLSFPGGAPTRHFLSLSFFIFASLVGCRSERNLSIVLF